MSEKRRPKSRTNNPDAMRGRILDAAADLFQARGYNDTSVQDVKRLAAVSSGAFHHHFASKKALGLAVITERVADALRAAWLDPMLAAPGLAEGLVATIGTTADELREQGFVRGCPLNNLAVELAYADADFRRALRSIFSSWRSTIAARVAERPLRPPLRDFSHDDIATFIIAAYSGAMTMSKTEQSPDRLETTLAMLAKLLSPATSE